MAFHVLLSEFKRLFDFVVLHNTKILFWHVYSYFFYFEGSLKSWMHSLIEGESITHDRMAYVAFSSIFLTDDQMALLIKWCCIYLGTCEIIFIIINHCFYDWYFVSVFCLFPFFRHFIDVINVNRISKSFSGPARLHQVLFIILI